MPERALGAFVRRSLEILEREHPHGHGRLRAALGRRTVALRLDGEPFVLVAVGPRLRLDPGCGSPSGPAVALTSDTVIDVLDGRTELLDALLADRIEVHGAVGQLAELWEATRLFLHGLIRCPSVPPLLDELRECGERDAPSNDLVSTTTENPRDQPDAS